MEAAEGAVLFHPADGAVHRLHEVGLPFAHEDAYLSAGEGGGEQGGGKAAVGLHVVGSFGYFRYHDVGLALGDERRYLFVLRVDEDGGLAEVLACELLVESAGVHHDLHSGLVDVGEGAVAVGLGGAAENGLAVCQVALAHLHGLLSGIGDGDASDGKVKCLRFCQHIGSQRRPRSMSPVVPTSNVPRSWMRVTVGW